MGKPTICIGKNKGADQLRSNFESPMEKADLVVEQEGGGSS